MKRNFVTDLLNAIMKQVTNNGQQAPSGDKESAGPDDEEGSWIYEAAEGLEHALVELIQLSLNGQKWCIGYH